MRSVLIIKDWRLFTIFLSWNIRLTTGIKIFAIITFDLGKMYALTAEDVQVPTEFKEYAPAEDAHMKLDHLIGAYLM